MLRSLAVGLALAAALPSSAAASPGLVPQLEALASKNNAKALYHLGMAYHLGRGVAVDKHKAFELFKRSAELGDVLGAYKVGCYYDGQGNGVVASDLDAALRYKLVAAKAGYSLAQHDIAGILQRRKDYAGALEWLKAAAYQGEQESMLAYGAVHAGAPGFPKDDAVSLAFFDLVVRQLAAPPQQLKQLVEKRRARLSPADSARADRLVRGFKPKQTSLTLEAKSGEQAAQALVANPS